MRDARATETARIEKVRDLTMRLTCPRCGAQYEIAAAAIPARSAARMDPVQAIRA